MSLETLRAIVELTELMGAEEERRRRLVQYAREEGESWTTIGDALGMTKQGAQQRYSSR